MTDIPILRRSKSAAMQWVVCPGAKQDAYISAAAHGTLLTASKFTSLTVLDIFLTQEEKVQYEVHLVSGGLLQIGWCVTSSGLPFSEDEGVGDFPLSVAADGHRSTLWNVVGHPMPLLQWQAGDVLSCYADICTGDFSFSLNGVPCASHKLPTKMDLLNKGVRWMSDKQSIDEMLVYSPALSLDQGEACIVNCGEAPMLYPKEGYVSVIDYNLNGSLSSCSQGSGQLVKLVDTSSSASSVSFLSLGNVLLEELFFALQFNFPHLADDLTVSSAVQLLVDQIEQRPVGEVVLAMCSWFEADVQTNWKLFTLTLYLWILRLYSKVASADKGARRWDYKGRKDPVDVERLQSIFQALYMFLPEEQFYILPTSLFAILEHRHMNTFSGRQFVARAMYDLVQHPQLRHAWVRQTCLFNSTMMNLFCFALGDAEECAATQEILDRKGETDVTQDFQSAEKVYGHQQLLWRKAGDILDTLVSDEDCRGPLSCSLEFLLMDPFLSRHGFQIDSTRSHYNHSMPYTFSMFNPTCVLGTYIFYLAKAMGDYIASVDSLADTTKDATKAGLQWAPMALRWLPPSVFYKRHLGADGFVPNLIDVRFAGSYHRIQVECDDEAKAAAQAEELRRAEAAEMRLRHNDVAAAADEEEEEEAEAPVAVMRRNVQPSREASHSRYTAPPALDTVSATDWGAVANDFTFKRLALSEGGNLTLPSRGEVPDAEAVDDAFQARSQELFLAIVMAFSTVTIPLLTGSLGIHDALLNLVQEYDTVKAMPPVDPNDALSSSSSVCSRSRIGMRGSTNSRVRDTRGEKLQSLVKNITFILKSLWPILVAVKRGEGMTFAAVAGEVIQFYYSRMRVYEQFQSNPLDHFLRHAESIEAVRCPPRAFYVLPLPLINVFADCWVFYALTANRLDELVERFPTLYLSFYDSRQRHLISHPTTREQLYRAMATLLGNTSSQRQHVANLLAAEVRQRLDDKARRMLPLLHGSILDCLDVYAQEENFNDTSALNFLFSLAQDDFCAIAPPRMLEECFWWLSDNDPSSEGSARAKRTAANAIRRPMVSADATYFDEFLKCVQPKDLYFYLLTNINRCNRLLTQLSPLLLPKAEDVWTLAEMKDFHAKYTLLRKNLYLFDYLSRALELSNLPVVDNKDVRSGVKIGDEALSKDQIEGMQMSIMELIMQSLIRIPFVAPSTDSTSASASRSCGTSRQQSNSLQQGGSISQQPSSSQQSGSQQPSSNSPQGSSQQQQQQGGSSQKPSSTAKTSSTPESSVNSRSRAKLIENVLLGRVTVDKSNRIFSTKSSCTVTGLLAPVFVVLARILNTYGTMEETNPFLYVAIAELPELVRRCLVALSNGAWWALPPASNEDTDDEYISKEMQDQLRGLQHSLNEVIENVHSHASQSRWRPCDFNSYIQGSTTGGATSTFATTIQGNSKSAPASAMIEIEDQEHPVWMQVPREKSEDLEGTLCLICQENPVDIAFVPCGHECCHLCFARYRNSLLVKAATSSTVSRRRAFINPGDEDDLVSSATAKTAEPEGPLCFFCKTEISEARQMRN